MSRLETMGVKKEVVAGLLVAILGAVVLKLADLPSRMSVAENRLDSHDRALSGMDKKLDMILFRLPPHR